MSKRLLTLFILTLPFLSGCHANAERCLEDVRTKENITVGKVQCTIRLGMPSAEVVENLGSPNIVSTDEQRREVWVYDKISTETVYSKSAASGGIGALILGSTVGGFGSVGTSKSAGAKSTSQRTLTIIIKFDNNARVRDIAYHSSQF